MFTWLATSIEVKGVSDSSMKIFIVLLNIFSCLEVSLIKFLLGLIKFLLGLILSCIAQALLILFIWKSESQSLLLNSFDVQFELIIVFFACISWSPVNFWCFLRFVIPKSLILFCSMMSSSLISPLSLLSSKTKVSMSISSPSKIVLIAVSLVCFQVNLFVTWFTSNILFSYWAFKGVDLEAMEGLSICFVSSDLFKWIVILSFWNDSCTCIALGSSCVFESLIESTNLTSSSSIYCILYKFEVKLIYWLKIDYKIF